MRSKFTLATTVLAILGVACGTASPSASSPGTSSPPRGSNVEATPAASSQQATDSDIAVTVFDNVAMTLPKGWLLTQLGGHYQLVDPDRDLSVWILRKPNAGDSDEKTLETSWKEVDPSFSLAKERVISPPPDEGWSRITQISYETPAAEQRVSIGIARTADATTYIHLLSGPIAALSRRGAQLQQLIESFTPDGLHGEDFAGRVATPLTTNKRSELDDFISDIHRLSGVPAIAVGVVADGKIVFAKGYGVEYHGGKAVGPDSLFMIGSTTKSLTTLMMARQVDAKRFSWQTPVTSVYPAFAVGDPQLTQKLTMETMVCACSGMPRQDMEMLFEWRGLGAKERLAELRIAQPTTEFREVFQYSNPMVAAGGFIAAGAAHPKKSLDAAYDMEMTALFTDMGMRNTTFNYDLAQKKSHGRPHGRRFGDGFIKLSVDVERAIEPVRPAGAAFSSANDMARYLLIEMAEGVTPEGKRIVSAENLLHRRQPQVQLGDKGSYGLGLMIHTESGVPMVHHGGNTLGFTTEWFYLPEQKVGAVILVNVASGNSIGAAVRRRLFELWFSAKQRALSDFTFSLKQSKKGIERALAKMSTPTNAWISPILGSYHNDALGQLDIKRVGTKFVADAGEWSGTIHRTVESDGSEYITVVSPPLLGISFEVAKDTDSKAKVKLLLKDSQKTYEFIRRKR